jgi:hypothetical protein
MSQEPIAMSLFSVLQLEYCDFLRSDMERFNLKKLNDVEGKEQHRVEVSNRFAALEDWMQRWKLIVSGKRLERI